MPIAIVPAAGASRRMGRAKLHLPFGTTTILGATVEALRAGGAPDIVLVAAPDDTETAAWAALNGCRCAVNPSPSPEAMLTSVWAGLAHLGGAEAVAARSVPLLVCPADLPRLRAETVARLLAEASRSDAALAVPEYRGRRGHPLWIAARLIGEIPRLDPAVGLRQLRTLHPGAVARVAVDDAGVVQDVDTPEDYASLDAPAQPIGG